MAAIEQLDTTIDIVTPENIAFNYRAAGPFRRLPAFLLDLLVKFCIFLVFYWILAAFSLVAGGAAIGALAVVAFVLEWFYGGLFETFWNGQTPGKWVLGIRVLSVEGQPINGMQAVMRNVLRTCDMMPLISAEIFNGGPLYIMPLFLVGLIFMMMNRRFQRLGDFVCGTMVVLEERQWLTGMAKLEDPRTAQLATYLPADFQVNRSMARALANYVERRRFFSVLRRREVARHLGEPLVRQFGLPSDTSHDLLLCALYYRAFIADRGEVGTMSEPASPFHVVDTGAAGASGAALTPQEPIYVISNPVSSRPRGW